METTRQPGRAATVVAAMLLPRGSPRARRRGDLLRLALAVLGVGVTAAFSSGNKVSAAERHVFVFVNRLPDAASPFLYTLMQAGNFAAVFVAAAAALAARRPRLALALVVGGTSAWLLAKAVKRQVERGRPDDLLPGVVFHGPQALGLGYPSGHAAVAALIVTVAGPYLTRPVRWAGWGVVWVVAVARVYTGAHLPLDVLGGVFLGWGVGSLVNLVFSTPAPRDL